MNRRTLIKALPLIGALPFVKAESKPAINKKPEFNDAKFRKALPLYPEYCDIVMVKIDKEFATYGYIDQKWHLMDYSEEVKL